MTVKELIETLQGYPEDAVVHIAQPTHNHWQNVAAPVLDHVGQCDVAFSEYLRQPQVLPEGFDPEEQDGETEWVVVLADHRSTVDV